MTKKYCYLDHRKATSAPSLTTQKGDGTPIGIFNPLGNNAKFPSAERGWYTSVEAHATRITYWDPLSYMKKWCKKLEEQVLKIALAVFATRRESWERSRGWRHWSRNRVWRQVGWTEGWKQEKRQWLIYIHIRVQRHFKLLGRTQQSWIWRWTKDPVRDWWMEYESKLESKLPITQRHWELPEIELKKQGVRGVRILWCCGTFLRNQANPIARVQDPARKTMKT